MCQTPVVSVCAQGQNYHKLQLLLNTVGTALAQVVYMVFMLVLVVFMFAVLGMQLFAVRAALAPTWSSAHDARAVPRRTAGGAGGASLRRAR